MGMVVFIMGESGCGKSRSIKNLNPETTGIFNVAGKPLPFRSKFKAIFNTSNYNSIVSSLKKNTFKCYVIDDSQYLMAFQLMANALERGYDKFTKIAADFANLLDVIMHETSEDTIVYFLHHVEMKDNKIKLKTVGKMLDNVLTLEGLSTVVLYSVADENGYKFITNNQGDSTAKSPEDMFEAMEIENDLKLVDSKIREYYGW